MPALGGRVKVEFVEFDKNLHVCMLFQNHPRNPKISNLQQTTSVASKLDMFRHGLRHFDMC